MAGQPRQSMHGTRSISSSFVSFVELDNQVPRLFLKQKVNVVSCRTRIQPKVKQCYLRVNKNLKANGIHAQVNYSQTPSRKQEDGTHPQAKDYEWYPSEEEQQANKSHPQAVYWIRFFTFIISRDTAGGRLLFGHVCIKRLAIHIHFLIVTIVN